MPPKKTDHKKTDHKKADSKKADPTKRSDVSMAQFVYDGDIEKSEPTFATPATTQSKHITTSTSTSAIPMETDEPTETSLLVDKEKDKDKEREKEKKDREKDSSKEAVTIEVCVCCAVLCRRPRRSQITDKGADSQMQDLTLPKSIITRLAKGVLPSNTQIQANAILAMSKSATIFVNHLANAYVRIYYPTPIAVQEQGVMLILGSRQSK